jgi:hypothetical protein
MTPHAWHRVIDEVAREMTAGTPAPDFRARVIEQVTRTPQPGRLVAFLSTWRFASIAAAASVVAIAAIAIQPFRASTPERSVAQVSAPVTPGSAAAPADSSSRTESPMSSGVSRPAPAPQPPTALVEWRSRRIPALEAVAELELEGIQPAGLSISQLSVTPLVEVTPIVIPPIDHER